MISLKEELKCIESYIYLLEARFGDNLEIELRISPEDYGHYIVPLSLQILLENAIKHNVVSSKKPLKVEIFSNDEGKIIVRNNLQLKDQEVDSTGTGLQNIDNRYQLVSEKRIEVSETNQSFFVAIPLLEISDYEGNHH